MIKYKCGLIHTETVPERSSSLLLFFMSVLLVYGYLPSHLQKKGCDNTVCTDKMWKSREILICATPSVDVVSLLKIWKVQCVGNASHNNCRLCHKRYLLFKITDSSFESVCRCEGCKDLLTLNKENMSVIQHRRGHVDTVEMSACEGLWWGLQVATCSYYIWFSTSCEKKLNVCYV